MIVAGSLDVGSHGKPLVRHVRRYIRRIVIDDRGKSAPHATIYLEYRVTDGLDISICMNSISVKAEKECVAIRIERQPLRQWTVEKPVIKLHQCFFEERRIHGFRRADDGAKTH